MEKITNKRTVLLIDEYDSPIHAAHLNGYHTEMINFMRSFLTAGLKDNSSLERSVMTGILRTAKEGIFSGLNNLNVCTLFDDLFANKFGFVSHEVDALLKDHEIAHQGEPIKAWYNGYHAGETVLVYNPWSILECAKKRGQLQAYWVNTSDNALIKKILIHAHEEVKEDLERILNNIPVIKEVDDAFIFPGIEKNERAVWSLLLFSGYLTYSKLELTEEGKKIASLVIPNKEIRILYKSLITEIVEKSFTTITITKLLTALLNGDIHNFSYALQEFVLNSMSFYDFSDTEPEKSYHLFMLGLLVVLSDRYTITSNREAGYGRYDIMLTPRDITKAGIIIEFKKVDHKDDKKTPSFHLFEKTCQQALDQIKQKNYVHELRTRSVATIIIYGVAFFKKQLLIKAEQVS